MPEKESGRTPEGKVWLVGAGPGDSGLLTVKGARVLAGAQVVVYDALVDGSVLMQIPRQAERIYAGKRQGRHALSQSEINECLVRYARAGKRVVRLKGGDPFLFGRGGEEMEALVQAGVSFEVVPGVPSAVSVPAYSGIPVTHRDFSSCVHIVTGHKRGGEAADLDFDALVQAGGTFVFLMSVSSLPGICRGLLRAGMPQETPAAVLSAGTTASARQLLASLGMMEREMSAHSLPAPAVFVVGRVCGMAENCNWYNKLPLSGCCVLITSPQGRAAGCGDAGSPQGRAAGCGDAGSPQGRAAGCGDAGSPQGRAAGCGTAGAKLAEMLREQGAHVLECPAVRTEPCGDDRALRGVFDRLEQFSWIAFTSPSAVEFFFDYGKKAMADFRRFAGIRFAVTGPGTRDRLYGKSGIRADLMPQVHSGGELGRLLAGVLAEGDRVLFPRAETANPDFARELKAAGFGAGLCEAVVCRTVPVSDYPIDLGKELTAPSKSFVVFTNGMSVEAFFVQAEKAGLPPDAVSAVCIGKSTYSRAQSYGCRAYMAAEATPQALFDKILEVSGEM